MERALEVESRNLDYRPTSCGLGHITHLISLGLTFYTHKMKLIFCIPVTT